MPSWPSQVREPRRGEAEGFDARLKVRPARTGSHVPFANAGDAYLTILLFAVAGYAMLGKGFAYAGLPPLFPGELILALGLLTLIHPRMSPAVLWSLPTFLIVLLIGWTLMRTLPFVGPFKIDALRDSVVAVYGLYAIIVANLILADPRRIDKIVKWAGLFFTAYVFVVMPLYTAQLVLGQSLPSWPGSPDATIISLRSGEIAVHVAAAAVFALVALKRNSLIWLGALLLSIAILSALSRGAMVAMAVPILAAMLLTGRVVPAIAVFTGTLPIVAFLYIANISFEFPGVERTLDVRQIINNAVSMFADTGIGSLDDNRGWRLEWWGIIVNYTFFGEYFWTGKGFGPNIALQDGFVGTDNTGPLLRSPHSVHMTFLARGGVPGFTLWILLLISWSVAMIRGFYRARARGDRHWAGLFMVCFAYATAAVINASFDVALEGPMVGIVFWVVIGTGIGASMAYGTYQAAYAAPGRPAQPTVLEPPQFRLRV